MQTQKFGRRMTVPSTVAIRCQILNLDRQDQLALLNDQVSVALRIAEAFKTYSIPTSQVAYRRVSQLEVVIASLTTWRTVEGALARKGAVSAALKAGDERRALELAATYSQESPDSTLCLELVGIFEDHYYPKVPA